MSNLPVCVTPNWLHTVFWFAVAGALLAFAMILYNLPKQDDFDDTDYPNEEDE